MATIIATITAICSKFSITETQFSKATYCTDGRKGYYIVESQSEVGKEYKVTWNAQYKALACTCKAGENGVPCWHKRAAMAAQEHYKAEQAARRQVEQAEIEAQEYYRFEQAMHELETTLDKLDEIALKYDELDALRVCGILS